MKKTPLRIFPLLVGTLLVTSSIGSAQTAESRERCATRLSGAILGQTASAALFASANPQTSVDAMIATPVFQEKFSRFINSKFNVDPGAAPAEDASYYLSKYVLANNRPWKELFNGQYRVDPGATATADAVVTADPNGLGYFRSRAWMVRYAGNELDGYRIAAGYRMMNNVLGIKLVAAVNTNGVNAAGRMQAACAGCHYNSTFGLDYVAKILSRRVGTTAATMTFAAPNEGAQPVLGGLMLTNDKDFVNNMITSTDFNFNACRTAVEFLYARPEFK